MPFDSDSALARCVVTVVSTLRPRPSPGGALRVIRFVAGYRPKLSDGRMCAAAKSTQIWASDQDTLTPPTCWGSRLGGLLTAAAMPRNTEWHFVDIELDKPDLKGGPAYGFPTQDRLGACSDDGPRLHRNNVNEVCKKLARSRNRSPAVTHASWR